MWDIGNYKTFPFYREESFCKRLLSLNIYLYVVLALHDYNPFPSEL